jgi:DNA polymerase III delta prime subunit
MNNFFKKPTTEIKDTFTSKYKPYFVKDFSVNQKFKDVLNSFLKIDDLNILVCGPSSCGKTCLLYALIRDYYGLKKNDPIPENNIMMINTLKEQGINYYRNEMRTFCQSRCSIYGKKKLVIVDDLDLISDQCQQVFRNYIDKYKNNVHFVSVCTTLEKVIESIQSRLHIVHMDLPQKEDVQTIMNNVIAKEQMIIDSESKQYILHFTNYQLREVLNYLEKLFILKDKETITLEEIKQSTSSMSFHHFEQYIQELRHHNVSNAIKILYNIYDYGYSVIDIYDFFFHFVKITPLLQEKEKYLILPLLCKYITYFHNIHEDIIESVLFTNDLHSIIGLQ